MINEDQKIALQLELTNYISSGYCEYSGYSYSGVVYRENDSFDFTDPCVLVTWVPMNKKQKTVSVVRSQRENRLYNNYGYIESELCILNVFAEDVDGMRGRRIADGWLRKLETYIKNNWNTLISGIGVKLDSFTSHREVPEFFTERLYGLETRFEMTSYNIWTNEPVSGATDLTDITAVSIVDTPYSGMTGMVKVWVI